MRLNLARDRAKIDYPHVTLSSKYEYISFTVGHRSSCVFFLFFYCGSWLVNGQLSKPLVQTGSLSHRSNYTTRTRPMYYKSNINQLSLFDRESSDALQTMHLVVSPLSYIPPYHCRFDDMYFLE